ncbi:MAG: acyl-CoA thioesterase [Bacteroidota bacterium]
MNRVKIKFPDKIIFSTEVTISIADINYGGHLGNDKFLTLMHEARLRWFKSIGFKNEKDIVPPVGIIVADAAIQFKAEAFHGDILTIELAVENISRNSFDMLYKLMNQDRKLVALGKTGVVCFNYVEAKVAAIPGELVQYLK